MDHWNRHRQENAIRILEALWHDRSGSRAQLARSLRLDRSTVGAIADHLVEWNVIHELDSTPSDSPTGRPAMQLGLRVDYGYSLGVEVDADTVHVVAVDLSGNMIFDYYGTRTTLTPTHLTEDIAAAIQKATSEISADIHGSLLGVAVGVGGIVDSDSGTVLASRILRITQPFALGPALEALLPVPVRVYNDADACAVGELEYGQPSVITTHQPDDILFVLVRYNAAQRQLNAGLGIILDGHLRESHSGAGREFRSPFVDSESSEQFRVADLLRHGKLGTGTDLASAFADELGVSVAFLVHALDLRHVILGGDVLSQPFEVTELQERLRHHVSTATANFASQPLALRTPTHAHQSVPWGAAAAVIRRLFAERNFPVSPTLQKNQTNHMQRTSLAPKGSE